MAKPRSSLRMHRRSSPPSSSNPGVKFSSLDNDDGEDDRFETKSDGSASPTNVQDFPKSTTSSRRKDKSAVPSRSSSGSIASINNFRRVNRSQRHASPTKRRNRSSSRDRKSSSSASLGDSGGGSNHSRSSVASSSSGKVSSRKSRRSSSMSSKSQSSGAAGGDNDQQQSQQSPRRLFGGLGRRFSKNRNAKTPQDASASKSSSSTRASATTAAATLSNDSADPEDSTEEEEHDPVMKIFESRNTQRVRFTFDQQDTSDPKGTKSSSTTNATKSKSNTNNKTTTATSNVKQFMSRALFGNNKTSSKKLNEEMKREVHEAAGDAIVWASAADTPSGPELVHTTQESYSYLNTSNNGGIVMSFVEDPKARATVTKLLSKARRAENIHFRFEYAVKCYVRALDVLKKAKYPQDHPTVVKTIELLNTAHHVLSSYNNSASIVKMGIKYEDAGELVRALKMYTIAYRIRRDNLNRNHPSLVVLLNMLGSVQIKRGELKEAMQIYELALKDSPVMFAKEDEEMKPPTANLLAKSVTYREMGAIYERIGNTEEALSSYHKSLECVAEWKEAVSGDAFPSTRRGAVSVLDEIDPSRNDNDDEAEPDFGFSTMDDVQLAPSSTTSKEAGEVESGEMELFLSPKSSPLSSTRTSSVQSNKYESFFPSHLEESMSKKPSSAVRDSFADMDLALTIHSIAQLHRCQGKFSEALDAYEVALRGMKYALGKFHPNVAAVLGNMGNLQKEMGNMDAAYKTYQEVLGIESYRLGLSHPDVAITLHNIATIDAAKGNYDHALTLYRKVIGLQKKLFGEDHISVAVTAACMGDVYERLGEIKNAIEIYEEAVRIKAATVGRHSTEVARILHKLGKLSILKKEYHMAESFISRSVLIYRLNKLNDDHEWIIDAYRDTADIDAALAMGGGRHFE
eukprot:CAMPEP_0119560600 /NCGR_PEP_ID=MMETSP1352-20130426/15377_1 /TAXON_ID=265584 /ORGANISM="Stauroneis constricta, Strain CCMP1120" /LENGTH=913 /DNA_ID=CAMNT_0007608623 /DNA_START=383 /DNA_END=3121 /DNA_ORIENTATION=+